MDFLELLAREAPAMEFDRPVLEARAAGAPADVLDELEQARATALRVRALLERRRQRETELSALIETVGDLAMLHDLDAVLEAIVRRARKLLGTDVTYMTLHDEERGDTYMRVTEGSVSARFQQLRLAMGTGLGGLVAQTAKPYLTADYAEDTRFAHAGYIDSAVAEEGIVAILGVPMKLGPRIVGVLFAANRTARPFAREEVTLLGSLAAHAAVAIDNARLLAETRAALAELSAANRVAKEHSDAVERAAQAHDRLAELVLRGGDVTDLAETVAGLLPGSVAVLDLNGRVLAQVGELGPGTAVTEAAAVAQQLGRTAQRGELWATAVSAGGENVCTLVLRGDPGPADLRILERAATVTALLLLSRRSLAEAESQVRGELLDDLISRPGQDTLADRAHRIGIDLSRQHVVLVLHGPAELRRRITNWASGQATLHGGLAAYRDGLGVLLLPGDQPGSQAQRAARELRTALGVPVTVGAAGPVHGAAGVAAGYLEAERCAAALIALDQVGAGASHDDLGFVGMLIGSGDPAANIAGHVRRTLGAVLDYDAKRGTLLRATLEAYFACGGSPSRAAEVLHVHVNTVTQRLERLGTLLGADWQQPGRALEVQLALQLHRLRTAAPR